VKRKIAILGAVLLVASTAMVAWTGSRRLPPRLIVRYGLPPVGGPTGRVREIAHLAFVEIEPGYAHIRRRVYRRIGDLPGRYCAPLALDIGTSDVPFPGLFVDEWVEIPRKIWVSWRAVAPENEEEICRSLGKAAGGKFRRATREEVYVAADGDALDAHGLEVEQEHDPHPGGERESGGPSRAGPGMLLTGSRWASGRHEVGQRLDLPVHRGVRLVWIPPDDPSPK
jgi:hypothetical protein